jgi:anti-sigma regulatory factor (Ser/Thr protein kinase)
VPDDEGLDVAARIRLPSLPESASRARRFITDFCQAAKLPADMCHTAALLVSELVTNAVIHGRTSATIEVHQPPGTLRVAVRDDNPVLPPVGELPSLTAESGRGLTIVSVLADNWGIEAVEGGKAVWFELDLSA